MKTPSERLAALPDDQRAALLDPAEAEFVALGYEGASLNRILTAAQMSKGQAYHYITGKADLYLAVCARRFEPFLLLVEAWEPSDNGFWGDVETLSNDLLVLLQRDETTQRLARGVYGSTAGQQSLAPLANRLAPVCDRLIAAGQEAGAIRHDLPDGLVRAALLGAGLGIDRWSARHMHELTPQQLSRTTQAAFEMLRNLVAPASGQEENHAL